LQDAINEKTVAIGVKGVKLTTDTLTKAIQKVLVEMEKTAAAQKTTDVKRGKQTLNQLYAQNTGLSEMPLTTPDLWQLKRAMNKYEVDFAVKRSGNGNYNLFFKGRDQDAIKLAFDKYTQKMVKQADRPSIRKTLFKFRADIHKNNKNRAKTNNKQRDQSL
jgi:hypothetical protein